MDENNDHCNTNVLFRKNAIKFESTGLNTCRLANNCQTKCIIRNEHRFMPSTHHFGWRGGVQVLDNPVDRAFTRLIRSTASPITFRPSGVAEAK